MPKISEAQARYSHKLHLSGVSVNKISILVGTSRQTVYFSWKKLGLKWRDRSSAEKMKWSGMTKEERSNQVKGAHDAVRGTKQSWSRLCRRAQAVFLKGTLSAGEKEMRFTMNALGIKCNPLLPVGKYNIDIAVPSHKIAVEINGGGWHGTEKKKKQDAVKKRYLESKGWRVFYLWRQNGKFTKSHFKALLSALNVFLD